MLTRNINNKISFKHNRIPQKKKMQLHKKIFLTLAASLLFTVNYGNLSYFAVPITQDQAEAFRDFVQARRDNEIEINNIPDTAGEALKNAVQKVNGAQDEVTRSNSDLHNILNVKLILLNLIEAENDVFDNFDDGQAARIITDSLLKMYNTQADPNTLQAFNNLDDLTRYLANADGSNYASGGEDNRIRDTISAILRDVYDIHGNVANYDNNDSLQNHQEFKNFSLIQNNNYPGHFFKDIIHQLGILQGDKQTLQDQNANLEQQNANLEREKRQLEAQRHRLEAQIKALKAKDPEKSDPKIQDEIKQKEAEAKKVEEESKKNQKIIDQINRPEVIKVQEKLQIAQAPIESQIYAVQNIAAIQSSIVSNITDTRMNINKYDTRISENENKPVAAGSQTVDARITPTSWDIWASGHMGEIRQDAANGISANSQTDFYGGSIGIDKIFANNTVVGLALSYGESNTEYSSKTNAGATVNEKWASNYYQADIYAHHNFTDSLFVQLIGGIGTYGDGTTIGNIFDFSPEKFTFGYHGNATIGYSIFGGEDSNFAITPKLGVSYYYLNIPDSIFVKKDSSRLNDSSTISTSTTLGRFDGIAGVNIKIFSTSSCNVKIIPEITAAIKLRLSDNVEGINADNIKLPVVKTTNSNDLSANALAAPEQLFTLGGALTVVTNNNFSINLNGSLDFATQYLAMVGGISVKLSF